MPEWPRYPAIYEINTWVWLSSLSQKLGVRLNLGCVPDHEWDAVAEYGFDAVWLMGVWERSPAGIDIAMRNEGLAGRFSPGASDFARPTTSVLPIACGATLSTTSSEAPAGLAVARKELAKRGMRLMLDFVPNHVAPDHPWVDEHPEYFIRGATRTLQKDPGFLSFPCGKSILACGRDPYFPAWPDVLQLNAFNQVSAKPP